MVCRAGVAQLAGFTSAAESLVFAATAAGFALLPDLDHPSATAARSPGWFTRAVSWALRNLAEMRGSGGALRVSQLLV